MRELIDGNVIAETIADRIGELTGAIGVAHEQNSSVGNSRIADLFGHFARIVWTVLRVNADDDQAIIRAGIEPGLAECAQSNDERRAADGSTGVVHEQEQRGATMDRPGRGRHAGRQDRGTRAGVARWRWPEAKARRWQARAA